MVNQCIALLVCFKFKYFFRILENIALHKIAWQLYPYNHYELGYSLNASKAVDGLKTNLSYLGIQCTESSNYKDEAMWRVDRGSVLGIHHITIYYRTDNAPWGKHRKSIYLLF